MHRKTSYATDTAGRSWKLVATALSDSSGHRQKNAAIVSFLDDDYVRGLLKAPSTAFPPPNEAARKEYESKTAPINVTTASTERFDIKQIKEDAEWLGKNAKINLVAALRVVMVEYQSRASRHLMGPLSTQDAANLQEAAGLQNGEGTAFLSDLGAATALDDDEIHAEFAQPKSRKRRLFDTLLTERRCFMMAAEYSSSIKLYGRIPILAPGATELAELYKLLPAPQTRDESEAMLPAYLHVVTDCMGRIETGLKSATDESLLLTDEVEIDWLRTLLNEAVHALSVVFQVADSFGNDFPPSAAVNQWFSLMEAYAFFSFIQPVGIPTNFTNSTRLAD